MDRVERQLASGAARRRYTAQRMIAFVRDLSPQLEHCELSFLQRVFLSRSSAPGSSTAATSRPSSELGCEVHWLPALAEHADGVFVEDTAVLVPELAVITRPGAASRRGEVESVAAAARAHTPLARVREPATLEGGDVLQDRATRCSLAVRRAATRPASRSSPRRLRLTATGAGGCPCRAACT